METMTPKLMRLIEEIRTSACVNDVHTEALEELLQDALNDAYDAGYDAGFNPGYEAGYYVGRME